MLRNARDSSRTEEGKGRTKGESMMVMMMMTMPMPMMVRVMMVKAEGMAMAAVLRMTSARSAHPQTRAMTRRAVVRRPTLMTMTLDLPMITIMAMPRNPRFGPPSRV